MTSLLRKFLIALAAVIGLGAAAWCLIDWSDAGADDYAGGIVLRDSAGRVMRVSLGEHDTDCRPYYRADPDDWIVKALVAAEDGEFWQHRGVRPLSIVRAFFQNLTSRRRISGASTITMQAVRLIAPHPKTYFAKFVEAVQAIKMERQKDKRWILSQYLNRAPFGSNLVGIEAAAQGWFGKGAKDLGVGEAAILAGMVQAPSRFRPDRSLDAALRRREYVLDRMLAMGYVTDEQRRAASSVMPTVCRSPRPFDHPFFCDWALARIGRDREGQRHGGDIVTTLDEDAQRFCETAVNAAAAEGGYSAAAVVMRVDTGAVLALACSGDYFAGANGQVNTAMSARPAGSTLKPFLAALAMDRGLVTPETRLLDAPVVYPGYRPTNFDAKYRGPVTLADSLVLSLNVPFVRLLRDTGVPVFGSTLRSLGFSSLSEDDSTYGLGMAIGNVEVTLVELVTAYATLARGGRHLPPAATDAAAKAAGTGTRMFTEGAAYLVSDMLSGDARSQAALGHVADVETARFAWKTGTSAAYRDAWTVAWNPEYAVGVWCGHKSGGFGDTKLVGAKASAPVCWKIARSLYPRNDGPWFAEPKEIVRRQVCAITGRPCGPDCPRRETGRAIAGRTPNLPCRGHSGGGASQLRIARPENQAEFCLVPGVAQQRVICQVVGNGAGKTLWWFADGRRVGETLGTDPCCLEMKVGKHTVTCVTEDGETASVDFSIRRLVD